MKEIQEASPKPHELSPQDQRLRNDLHKNIGLDINSHTLGGEQRTERAETETKSDAGARNDSLAGEKPSAAELIKRDIEDISFSKEHLFGFRKKESSDADSDNAILRAQNETFPAAEKEMKDHIRTNGLDNFINSKRLEVSFSDTT